MSAADKPYLIFAAPTARWNAIAIRPRADISDKASTSLHCNGTGIAYPVNQDGRVIAYSDPRNAMQVLGEQCMVTGMDDYQSKPFALQE